MITSRILPAPLLTGAADVASPRVGNAIQRAVAALFRRNAASAAEARDRYFSQSVDHADFENRVRTWDAHEARLRCLPPVL
jgi:hypothetical protein